MENRQCERTAASASECGTGGCSGAGSEAVLRSQPGSTPPRPQGVRAPAAFKECATAGTSLLARAGIARGFALSWPCLTVATTLCHVPPLPPPGPLPCFRPARVRRTRESWHWRSSSPASSARPRGSSSRELLFSRQHPLQPRRKLQRRAPRRHPRCPRVSLARLRTEALRLPCPGACRHRQRSQHQRRLRRPVAVAQDHRRAGSVASTSARSCGRRSVGTRFVCASRRTQAA